MTDHLSMESPESARVLAITPDTPDTDPRGVRFSPAIKELAFSCWVESHGNAGRAQRLLAEECRARSGRPDVPSEDQLPTERTIQRWARNDGWEIQFVDAVSASYGHTLDLLTARLIRMGGQALDTIDDLTRPGHTPSKEEKVKLDAAKHVTTLLGIGTAGVRGGTPELAKDARTAEDLDSMTPYQRAQRNRERLEASREERQKRRGS